MNKYGVTSKFLIDVNNLIDKFEYLLQEHNFIDRELTEEEIEDIRIDICDHALCTDDWDYDDPCIEIITYGHDDYVANIAIECNNCDTVIVDNERFED